MNKCKQKLSLCFLLLVLLFLLAICFLAGKNLEKHIVNEQPNIIETKIIGEEDYPYHYISNNDRKEEYENAIEIDLNNVGNNYLIEDGGEYLLSGVLNGTIVIDAKDETVHLFLNNVTINSTGGPALIVKKANKVIITSLLETNNIISDNGDYKNYNEYEACINSESNLVFNGQGTLNIYGLYKDAVRTNDVVKIIDGTINIESKKTAIHGTDGIHICGGDMYIATEKYGLKSTKNGSDNRGVIIISGGDIDIIAGRYAFVSEASLYIYNCNINQKAVATYDVKNEKYIESGCINE